MSQVLARNRPAKAGDTDAPNERAIVVIPEAAERSSGETTAIVYDCRVGTSICEILKRSNKTVIANHENGVKGTRQSKIFDGI